MKIALEKVKQYNSTEKYVILVDTVPVAVVNNEDEASLLIAYLNNYPVVLKDSIVKSALDSVKANGVEAKSIIRIKRYRSSYVSVITYKNKIVALTKSSKRATLLLSYMNGEKMSINDGKIKRKMDALLA